RVTAPRRTVFGPFCGPAEGWAAGEKRLRRARETTTGAAPSSRRADEVLGFILRKAVRSPAGAPTAVPSPSQSRSRPGGPKNAPSGAKRSRTLAAPRHFTLPFRGVQRIRPAVFGGPGRSHTRHAEALEGGLTP